MTDREIEKVKCPPEGCLECEYQFRDDICGFAYSLWRNYEYQLNEW